jgi:predicted secreted Zn-dependent protease
MKPILPSLIASAMALCVIHPASAASVRKTYTYFAIGGTTMDEIQAELSARGPHVKSTGARHPGATRMEFNSRVGYSETPKGCTITSAVVTVKANVILPRWKRPRGVDSEVKFIWGTLESDIRRHEESHVVIAKNHARMLEQKLLSLGRQKSCAIASSKAEAASEKILAVHDKEQQRFDKIESINFESRLLRLLQYRYERSRKKQGGS